MKKGCAYCRYPYFEEVSFETYFDFIAFVNWGPTTKF